MTQYEEGYNSYGKPCEEKCPYHEDTSHYNEWWNGYYKAIADSYSTILERLCDRRIFVIEKTDDGFFWIEECCDNYYSERLTREDLVRLGNEIIELADKV